MIHLRIVQCPVACANKDNRVSHNDGGKDL